MVIKAKEIISDKNNVNSERKIAHCLLIQELKAIWRYTQAADSNKQEEILFLSMYS